jgi:hypothetical protein
VSPGAVCGDLPIVEIAGVEIGGVFGIFPSLSLPERMKKGEERGNGRWSDSGKKRHAMGVSFINPALAARADHGPARWNRKEKRTQALFNIKIREIARGLER